MTSTNPRPASNSEPAIADLYCQFPRGMLGVGSDPIRLTWRVTPADQGLVQTAYEIETASDRGFGAVLARSGVVERANQVGVPAPGDEMRSREVRYFRVRIRTTRGWTGWSEALRVEAGLLAAADWQALAITLPNDPGRDRQAPAPLLRRAFEVNGEVVRARLYATALGVYRLALNGRPVGDRLLAPGWTAYHERLVADTHDITALLRDGENVITATLGDGWYRGRVGWDPGEDRCRYGQDVALIAQLEIELRDGSTQHIATDEHWLATTAEVRSADLYDGCAIDLRERRDGCEHAGYDTSGWTAVSSVPFDPAIIEPRMVEPVRVVQTFPVDALPQPDAHGRTVIDVGQNIAGFVRLRVQGERGTTVTVRHAEVLEPDGSLHTRSLRSAKATDRYVLADARATDLEPAFTFHGFGYAEIETQARVLDVEFVAISSDTPRRGWFDCSDVRLSRFHENVVWSQRDNFVSVPTDCPQRDERLGWTGDAQAFAPTACTLFETEAFWTGWLSDLALEQDPRLGVSTVVPDVVLSGEPRYGRAGWADAATIVPWAVYESYGDPTVLLRQLESMRSWVESLRARRADDGLLPDSMQFGDWLDPDAPSDRPWESKADSRFLANAFFAHSSRLLSRVAAVLGEEEMAATYADVATDVAQRTWTTWAEHALETQTGGAVALVFELVPDPERDAVGANLARLVREADGRVATGFLGTPLVLPALAQTGHFDEAYQMLLRTEAPSWLYQVEQGATTVWERWDAIRPDGSIHDGRMQAPPEVPESDPEGGHMLSFNHYAYGAVIDWVYRHLAGLAPDTEAPGYRRVRLAPRPVRGIDWARASVATAYGTVATSWRLVADRFEAEVELPFGTSAVFMPPATAASVVSVDGEVVGHQPITLEPGRHAVWVTEPLIAGVPTVPAA